MASEINCRNCGAITFSMTMNCKGCNEQIDYWPLARIKTERAHDFYTAGPALTHSGKPCTWFWNTRAAEIVAYIENTQHVRIYDFNSPYPRITPLPELATK